MQLDLCLKPKEWHPLGQHNRIRCQSIKALAENETALMALILSIEWQGATETIRLSSDTPEMYAHGLRFTYKGGGLHEAQLEITLTD